MKDFSELDYAIWGLENDYYYLTGTLLFIFLLVYISIKIYKKRVKKKVEQSNLKILKTKTVGQVFVGVELSLIHLLLEAATMGIHVEIGKVNHVLGLKDKNIGLQKKVRSDVINTVNEKYAIIVNNEIQLISSIRKEEDKRYYEYFINDSELKSIKKILERK
jgi:flagellar biogenesis protein FliO